MGTRFELVLGGGDERNLRAAGEAALDCVSEWDARLSVFRRDSVLARVNREALARAVRVDAQTFELLVACRDLWRASAGAFDAALGLRMAQLGFRGPAGGARARDVAGAAGLGAAGSGAAGFGAVELDAAERCVRFHAAGLALDLGAIAKGHALDAAAAVLREAGVACALLHGGTSSVLALGAPPGARAWRVALDARAGAPCAELVDAALSVSAQRGRRNARGEGHVLDPRRGVPVASEALAAVSCPAREDEPGGARAADGWSTVLLVTGDLPPEACAARASGLLGEGGEPQCAAASRHWRAVGVRGPWTEL